MCRLCRTDGSLATEPDEMREIATHLYRKLLTEEALFVDLQGESREGIGLCSQDS